MSKQRNTFWVIAKKSLTLFPLWCSVVLRFNFSVLSEEIATRTKGKNAGEGLNHRGHRGHRERHSDFPLCPLCPLWLDFSDLCLRLGSGSAGLGSIYCGFRIIPWPSRLGLPELFNQISPNARMGDRFFQVFDHPWIATGHEGDVSRAIGEDVGF